MKIQVETRQVRGEYLPSVQYCFVRSKENHAVIMPSYGRGKEKKVKKIFEEIAEKTFAQICQEFVSIGCKLNHRSY